MYHSVLFDTTNSCMPFSAEWRRIDLRRSLLGTRRVGVATAPPAPPRREARASSTVEPAPEQQARSSWEYRPLHLCSQTKRKETNTVHGLLLFLGSIPLEYDLEP